MFYFLIFLFDLFFCIYSIDVTWHRDTKEICKELNCDTINNPFCTYNIGYRLYDEPPIDSRFECVYAEISGYIYKPEDIINKLGPYAVINFVGDSIVRSLFESTIHYLGVGYNEWYHNLINESSSWEGAYHQKIDHTYLCSPFLGKNNITISFLWRPMLENIITGLPWLRQNGKTGRCEWWENGDNMRHCDGSTSEGSGVRWQCENRTTSLLYFDPILNKQIKRQFIIVSMTGVHTAVKEMSKRDGSDSNVYLEQVRDPFEYILKLIEKNKINWNIRNEGGRNIFLLPLQIQPGHPGSTGGNKNKAIAMNNILDYYIREPFRLNKTALTQNDGFEIIDTRNITGNGINSKTLEPGSIGDGIHYPHIVNNVLIQFIFKKIYGT